LCAPCLIFSCHHLRFQNVDTSGEHTEEILKDVLGYDSEGIEELRRDGVV